jgi:iron complex transport system substrate-binding protein
MPPPALTRRQLLAGLAGTGLLAACSGPATAAGAAGSDGFPRTVGHEVGETTVPRRPERVACVTDGAELAALLALGVRPVGFGQRTDPLLPWLAEAGAGAPEIGRYALGEADTNFEQVAAWRPDLLVGQVGFVTPENLGRFTGIAPTVATSFLDWRESLRQVAEATGTEDRAAQVVADRDAAIDDAAQRLRPFAAERLAVLTVFAADQVYALNRESFAGRMLGRLGFPPLPAQRTPGEAFEPVSVELAGTELECDLALVALFHGLDRAPYDAVRATGAFDGISAFRTGWVVELSPADSQALYFSSALTVRPALRVLERSLAETRG